MGKTNITTFKKLTTLKVGGSIKYFRQVSCKKDIVDAVAFAKKNNLPIFIIGEGSDIAVIDKDFDGLVIKYIGKKLKIQKLKNSKYLVTAEAGMNWDKLVKLTVEKNLQGIECLSGIPGSVGASPIQNIGAYGQELSQTFVELTAYNIEKQKFVKFKNKNCKFGYRESIFKTKDFWQKYIISNVTLKLKKHTDQEISLQTIRDEILRVRAEKLENPSKVPNAGSFFKNPIISSAKKEQLSTTFKDLQFFKYKNKFKVSAGYLIEKSGWKGRSLGPVKVSGKHALILTNPQGKGNFSDIKKLADAIIDDVYKMFKIKLEPEVQYIKF